MIHYLSKCEHFFLIFPQGMQLGKAENKCIDVALLYECCWRYTNRNYLSQNKDWDYMDIPVSALFFINIHALRELSLILLRNCKTYVRKISPRNEYENCCFNFLLRY